MRKVILDTNFLLIPGRFRVDIFGELMRTCPGQELAVLRGSIDELEGIVASGNKSAQDRMAAKLGLELVAKKGLTVIDHSPGRVDDIIVQLAKEQDAIVATQDAQLKQRVKDAGMGVVVLRQKRYLHIIQG